MKTYKTVTYANATNGLQYINLPQEFTDLFELDPGDEVDINVDDSQVTITLTIPKLSPKK